MSIKTLHWIVDPICGWSYAALPLIQQIEQKQLCPQQLHFGGLFIGDRCQAMDGELRARITQFDHQIHQRTGAQFGEDYLKRLQDPSLVLNSLPAIQALVALKKSGNDQLLISYLTQLQVAYYQYGKNINQLETLYKLLPTANMHAAQWQQTIAAVTADDVNLEFNHAHALLHQVGGQGYPTAVLESSAGYQNIAVADYYHRTADFAALIQTQ
ncbi:DsbA family protein [Acinetobacter larvae]|uniref:DsbA family protein n=1 Tax=Acinetobacter larvae TaxID=1789224 RepID=A0A1B2M0U0_9GAMM|nr:hypothetical protein [Acinetobacter larvae]AOA58781.1 hypothetical protein BFG52_10750 [Acinetobacter larvae]